MLTLRDHSERQQAQDARPADALREHLEIQAMRQAAERERLGRWAAALARQRAWRWRLFHAGFWAGVLVTLAAALVGGWGR